ncbi:MAG TPA: MarR family transcriptional regulator, partial [Micromonosporaceae bacterium]
MTPQAVTTAGAAPAATDDEVDAVFAASRALVALSARSIADADGVTMPQCRMLVVLSEAPSNLTALAGNLDVAPSTAMRMIDRLVAGGLVVREPAPESRRETRLSVTADGRRTVRAVTQRRRRDIRKVL